VRGSLTKLNRATLSPLVVMDVHARDVTRALADSGVSEASDFQWTCQLRMYWEEETVPVRMMNASVRPNLTLTPTLSLSPCWSCGSGLESGLG